ncbi:MAG: NAD(P)-binding domain-containing protein [Chloroflexota bacterium]|nr:NAD(P)-binding domain-containing protein [Chloroflexota bacterium]
MQTEDVTIIGAGPAGIAVAIQLKRYGLDPVLLEKDHAGGLLVNANLVENYPGFPRGISGVKLVQLFQLQLERTRVATSLEEVTQLDYDHSFILKTSKRELRSRIVVIASGTRPRQAEFPPEAADRVFYEVSSLAGVDHKKIVIIGAGDAAFDYALNLSRMNEVTILNRKKERKCLPLLWERTQKTPRITYIDNAALQAIKSSGEELTISYKNPRGDWELGVDYVIFAIGRKAQLGYLSERLKAQATDLEESGLLYFVGDVKNDIYRQTSIAVGDGVRAAMKICRKFQGVD